MQLAEPPGLRLGRLARVEQRVSSRATRSSSAERVVERLDDALDDLVAIRRRRPRHASARRAAGSPDGQVDACDLEQRDVVGAGVDAPCAPLRRDPARCVVRRMACSRGHRTRAAGSPRGSDRTATRLHVYASERPAPTSASSTTRRRRCSFVRRPADVAPQRHRVRDAVEDESRDLLDEVDLAGRRRARARSARSRPSRRRPRSRARAAIARCSSGGTSRPISRDGALRTQANDRALRQPVVDVGADRSSRAPARSTSSRLASTAAGSARYGSTPFSHRFEPAVRRREPLRRAQDAERLEVGRLEEHLASSCSVTSLSSPPMIAASATARSPSVISRSSVVEAAERPVERPQLLARARVPDDDPAAGELRAVERVQRAAHDVHDVVRHVDDVRDRAHLGEEEPRPQPLRRRADRDVAEDPADVARAAVRSPRSATSTSSASTIAGRPAPADGARRRRAPRPRARGRPSRAGRRGSPSASRRAPGRGSAARPRAASPARARRAAP